MSRTPALCWRCANSIPSPVRCVLDLCAAPGGKLTFMAQLMRNEGRLMAHDLTSERLQLDAGELHPPGGILR